MKLSCRPDLPYDAHTSKYSTVNRIVGGSVASNFTHLDNKIGKLGQKFLYTHKKHAASITYNCHVVSCSDTVNCCGHILCQIRTKP
jgi:hypothetical protein